MNAGDFVIGTGAVRDDGATPFYVPPEFPAIASMEFVQAGMQAAKALNMSGRTHTGLIHSKASLYAREFKKGPLTAENTAYMKMLTDAGVLASEMEAAMLFVLAGLFNHEMQLKHRDNDPTHQVKAGAMCVILGEGSDFGTAEMLEKITNEVVQLSLQTIRELAARELFI